MAGMQAIRTATPWGYCLCLFLLQKTLWSLQDRALAATVQTWTLHNLTTHSTLLQEAKKQPPAAATQQRRPAPGTSPSWLYGQQLPMMVQCCPYSQGQSVLSVIPHISMQISWLCCRHTMENVRAYTWVPYINFLPSKGSGRLLGTKCYRTTSRRREKHPG